MDWFSIAPRVDRGLPHFTNHENIRFLRDEDVLYCLHNLSELLDEMLDTAKLFKTRIHPVMESCRYEIPSSGEANSVTGNDLKADCARGGDGIFPIAGGMGAKGPAHAECALVI